METKGDYAGASQIFEALVKAPDRGLAACALYYLGFCHEKLGNGRAKQACEQLIREFADQNELVTRARARLAAMQQAETSGGLILRKVWPVGKTDVDISTGSLSPGGRFVAAPDWTSGDVDILELATGREAHFIRKQPVRFLRRLYPARRKERGPGEPVLIKTGIGNVDPIGFTPGGSFDPCALQ